MIQEKLKKNRYNYKNFISFTVISIGVMVILTIGLYINNPNIILVAFLFTLIGMVCTKKENLFNYILFFIPSANVFKLSPGSFSLYTFISLFALALLISVYIKYIKYDVKQLVFIIILLCYSGLHLFNKSFNIYEFIGFFSILLLLAIFSNRKNELINVERNSISFIIGVFSSSIAGLILQNQPQMKAYLDVDTIYIANSFMSRFVGLNQDPNFYSLQVIVALSLLITVFISNNKDTVIAKIMFVTLSSFGFLSLSKTYLIIWSLIIICWLVSIIMKLTIKKIISLITMLFILIFINGKYEFTEKITTFYLLRFGGTNDLDSLTTGRTKIWEDYLVVLHEPSILLFGTGLNRLIREVSPHNTYLSIIYSFGLIGTILFLLYLIYIARTLKWSNKVSTLRLYLRVLPLTVYLIFIASIDLLFEDYFMMLFLLLFSVLYIETGKKFIIQNRGEN
ncbi:O-antigen ligase family protein [Peribacillus butanolivorans]|uniref:O-antigen ligase family protein n=1 Tax=Peribacillus butanolivorans TaxID=421767 RepID=UPI003671AA44